MLSSVFSLGLRGSVRAVSSRGVAPLQPYLRMLSTSRPLEDQIQYTICDEAPQLATYAFLPVIRRFTAPYGIDVTSPNISLAARIIAHFPERLTDEQREVDALSQLGELTQSQEANIIKLPNISASIPQLEEAIAELQGKGYNLPNYPSTPSTDEEKATYETYGKVLGSAVNPVLREGNSDRRVAAPVKAYAQKNRPPVKMRPFPPTSNTHVSSMERGDFFSSEKSHIFPRDGNARIELVQDGTVTVLKELSLQKGEVIDASRMSKSYLRAFFKDQIEDAKQSGIMLSLHMKATMMKISDPIIFGNCVSVYFEEVFEKYWKELAAAGVNPNNGIADMLQKIKTMPDSLRSEIEAAISATYEKQPGLAMVDSAKGITNLHVPNDVIIDASMPPLVRDGGMMWNKDDALEDTKAMIPDRCYAGIYKAMVEDCIKNGQFDHSTMGNVSNVGLMAQKAEEYGSHDKTFQGPPGGGTIRVVDAKDGSIIFQHDVEEGDIWRMCQTKDSPIRDWVKLAVSRARATGNPTIFWLNEQRAHDLTLMGLVDKYLQDHDTNGLDIRTMSPVDAMTFSCTRARAGQDTISVTGNVLRDYLTDLFPILELGTSAKMLSIVPLLAGGGLFETGAGGSAPKHVSQFLKENHLRWDSLGEYLALAVSFEHLGGAGNEKAKLLGETLNEAVGQVLDNNKSPSRKVNEIDNRGSTFYIALYWAKAMAKHDSQFADLAAKLEAGEQQIVDDLVKCQGNPVDVGGYYQPNDILAAKAMRPSDLFNEIIDQ